MDGEELSMDAEELCMDAAACSVDAQTLRVAGGGWGVGVATPMGSPLVSSGQMVRKQCDVLLC